MDLTSARESATMKIGYPTVSVPPFMTLLKGVVGFAVISLFFAGACAGLAQLTFGPAAQLLVAIIGAALGGAVAWYSYQPAEE
ncbi:MAG: hypothetical protein WCE79_22725 [Xanthobacteraceae bacterium]